jgi:cytochrome P450
MEAGGYYAVSRHEDVVSVCMQPEVFSSNLVAFVLQGTQNSTEILEIPDGVPRPRDVLAIADAPDHTLQRKRLNPAFKNPILESYRPMVELLARDLASKFIERGQVEWMSEFATRLPLAVISGISGLPAEDFERLRVWSDAGVRIVDGTATGDHLMGLASSLIEFQAYLAAALERAQQNPDDTLISQLARMIDANELDADESVSILLQLVVAGSDSTASLIGALAHRIAEDAELQQTLREQPDLRPAFIEEVLRLDSPFQGHFRVLTRDATVGGIAMSAGTRLMLHWGAANRDRAVFECPATLDPSRRELKKHLAFGYGIHRCIGAGLAQLEAAITLDILLKHIGNVRLASGAQPREKPSVFTQRLESLPLEFEAQPHA